MAVTGASGFLGRHVCAQARDLGWSVVGLGRNRARGAIQGVEFVSCDINDIRTMSAAFHGCDVIVHCAALCGPWGHPSDFDRVNVQGTRSVGHAGEQAQVPKLVHVSSASVYLEFADLLDLTEAAPLPRPIGHYARTKGLAEAVANTYRGDVVILRPRAIHGAGDPTLLPRLLKAGSHGRFPVFKQGGALADVTHVDTVVEAILASCEPAAAPGTYNVSHGKGIIVRDLLERVFQAAGLTVRFVDMPLLVGRMIASAGEGICRLVPSFPEPPLTRYALGLFAFSQTMDISAAASGLGWTPTLSLEEGLERTLSSIGVS